MDRERLVVLKSSSIGDHSSLLRADIYSNNGLRGRRQGFLDIALNADVPVPGDSTPTHHNLDLMTERPFAPVPFLGGKEAFPSSIKRNFSERLTVPSLRLSFPRPFSIFWVSSRKRPSPGMEIQ